MLCAKLFDTGTQLLGALFRAPSRLWVLKISEDRRDIQSG